VANQVSRVGFYTRSPGYVGAIGGAVPDSPGPPARTRTTTVKRDAHPPDTSTGDLALP
jgi:hypothetical protein